jgi:hypothetical protein
VVAATESGVPLTPEQARDLAGRLLAAADADADADALDAGQLLVQLAACSSAAGGHTPVIREGEYGWSVAYRDVHQLRADRDHLADLLRDLNAADTAQCGACGRTNHPARIEDPGQLRALAACCHEHDHPGVLLDRNLDIWRIDPGTPPTIARLTGTREDDEPITWFVGETSVGQVLGYGPWTILARPPMGRVVSDPVPRHGRYTHETCPNCLNRDARQTKGMVCQSCGHDHAPDATAQDPPELESPSGELTPREQALVAVYVALEEYNASRDDREPKALIPPSLRETIADAVLATAPAPPVTEDTSDGYHTFGELYEHRHALWCAFAAHMLRAHGLGMVAWKSRAHHPADQPIYPGHFIAGANLPGAGQVSYHLPECWWDACPGHVLPHAPAWDGHSPSDVVSRLTAYAALTALDAALPAPRPAGFKPIPDQARNAGTAGLAEYWPGWDADTECDAPLAEHDHENCYPMAWWPDRAAVAAAVVRGLVDAGWTLTPPAGGTS